jgi:hypothetical protein
MDDVDRALDGSEDLVTPVAVDELGEGVARPGADHHQIDPVILGVLLDGAHRLADDGIDADRRPGRPGLAQQRVDFQARAPAVR